MNERPQRSRRALALLVVGLVLMAGAVVAGTFRPAAFFHGYLFGFMLWVSVPLGCAAVLMLHHVGGGRWGESIRVPSERALRTLPLFVLLFVPIVIGLETLYGWARAGELAQSPMLQAKKAYLNVPFFLMRAGFFLGLWAIGGWLLSTWSIRQARHQHDATLTRRLKRTAALGLVVYFLTVTFASVDWVASLEPEWSSSIFGLYVALGQALTALGVLVVLAHVLAPSSERSSVVPRPILRDLGNLLLTFVVLHAYLAYAQFFLIWIGNLPREIVWYLQRTSGGWGVVSVGLMVIHFALPFFALLFRSIKKSRRALLTVVGVILFGRLLDFAWLVLPAMGPVDAGYVLLALAIGAAMGGLWLGAYLWMGGAQVRVQEGGASK